MRRAAELLSRIKAFLRLGEQSEEQYRSLIEESVVGFYRATAEGDIIMANKAFIAMMGCSSFDELKEWNRRERWVARRYEQPEFQKMIKGKKMISGLETRWPRKDGKEIYLRENMRLIRGPENEVLYFEGSVEDITELKLTEERLEETRKELMDLAEKALVGVYLVQDNIFRYVNPKLAEIFGYSVEELTEKMGPEELTHPEDWPIVMENYRRRLEGEVESVKYDFRGIKKDKSLIFAEVLGSRTVFRGRPAVIGTLMDITERKLREERLVSSEREMRDFAAYLQAAREEERTAIARELHDELSQQLTALRMDLVWLGKSLPPDQKELILRKESMIRHVDRLLEAVRGISVQLRPGFLEELGLKGALELYAEEFQEKSGIQCLMKIENEEIEPGKEESIALFRIFQEALTNVARHARAAEVRVFLRKKKGKVELVVRDNGQGITEEKIDDRRSFGLIGMRERARAAGGHIVIKGWPGRGTEVRVEIPVGFKGE